MLSSMYERIAGQPGGTRSLASARLRRRVLVLLHKALERSGMSQSDLAKKLGYRRSAVNQVYRGDGNVRIETLAEYLHELGYEVDLQLLPAGTHRREHEAAQAGKSLPTQTIPVSPIEWRVSTLGDVLSPTSSPSVVLRLGAVS